METNEKVLGRLKMRHSVSLEMEGGYHDELTKSPHKGTISVYPCVSPQCYFFLF